jgi:hypothetical protein
VENIVAVASAVVCAAALVLAAPDAHAITKDQCVDANTKAQSLRRDGQFAAAREQLSLCVDSRCPAIVRDDCTQRLDELDRAQPTIVFDAKTPTGDDIVMVHVAVDGIQLADVLDGRALRVDPGQHVFTFEVQGQVPTTYRFVLKEGEKDRRERITLSDSVQAPAAGTTGAPAEASHAQPQRIAGLVLGAVGLAGIGVGAVFGALTIHYWSNSQSECETPTSCGDHVAAVSDHDRAETAGIISTIGFIGGGVLLATGVVTWLMSPTTTAESAPPASARIVPAVGPGAAGVLVTGRF